MPGKPNDRSSRTGGQREDDQSRPRRGGYQRQGLAETAIKAFIRSIGSRLGRILVRAITGRR